MTIDRSTTTSSVHMSSYPEHKSCSNLGRLLVLNNPPARLRLTSGCGCVAPRGSGGGPRDRARQKRS
jgi:hypothetical protein